MMKLPAGKRIIPWRRGSDRSDLASKVLSVSLAQLLRKHGIATSAARQIFFINFDKVGNPFRSPNSIDLRSLAPIALAGFFQIASLATGQALHALFIDFAKDFFFTRVFLEFVIELRTM